MAAAATGKVRRERQLADDLQASPRDEAEEAAAGAVSTTSGSAGAA
jgi:hypothetical protein